MTMISATNVVELRQPPAAERSKACASSSDNPMLPGGANDPYVIDSLRLVRSFMLIADDDMRASIIGLVEKIAEQNPIFKK